MTTTTPLFGGALKAVLPTVLEDATRYRPVPDTQELFVSRSYESDLSVIFDILQRVSGTDEQAVAVHWDDVVPSPPTNPPDVGRGSSVTVIDKSAVHVAHLPAVAAYCVSGIISPSAPPADGNEAASTAAPSERVLLLMTVIRLPEQLTDLVVSVNLPFPAVGTGADVSAVPESVVREGVAVRDGILGSFEICDWGLFLNE